MIKSLCGNSSLQFTLNEYQVSSSSRTIINWKVYINLKVERSHQKAEQRLHTTSERQFDKVRHIQLDFSYRICSSLCKACLSVGQLSPSH